MIDKLMEWGMSLALIVFGGGSLVRYVLERRKAKADGVVAQATTELQIDAVQLENLRRQLELMRSAWAAERASLMGRISNLAEELAEERASSARKDAEVKELRAQVDDMKRQLDELGERLAALTDDN